MVIGVGVAVPLQNARPSQGSPGAGVDNLTLEDGSNLILTTGGTDVLLLA